jgi:hypothetical protein
MPTLSEAEKQERRRINASVVGTHLMEGLEPDEATSLLLQRYADGELSAEQLSAALHEHGLAVAARDLVVPQVA